MARKLFSCPNAVNIFRRDHAGHSVCAAAFPTSPRAMSLNKNILPLCFLYLIIFSCTCATPIGQLFFSRIFIVVMENTSPVDILKDSGFNDLLSSGTFLSDVTASGRPSQLNYVALLAGSTLGVTTNNNVDLASTSIVDKFEAAGITWKAYMEDYPGNCFSGASSGLYRRKHNPFMSFNRIR